MFVNPQTTSIECVVLLPACRHPHAMQSCELPRRFISKIAEAAMTHVWRHHYGIWRTIIDPTKNGTAGYLHSQFT